VFLVSAFGAHASVVPKSWQLPMRVLPVSCLFQRMSKIICPQLPINIVLITLLPQGMTMWVIPVSCLFQRMSKIICPQLPMRVVLVSLLPQGMTTS
jgi:hypothetical protein